MRIERIQGNEERRILTAMVVDSVALGRIATQWDREMFRSRWCDVIGKWCVDFYARYGKAPKGQVQGLFESWAQKSKDKDTVSLVEKFLIGLSGEYKELAREANSDYSIDLAAQHFTRVKLKRMFEAGQADVDEGKLDEALARVSSFQKVEMGGESAIDVLNDELAVQEAFEDEEEDLIEYPGALGQFFKGQLARDCFVSFLAPEKRGKTFWLMDIGWRAMLQRRKVAWFAAGDMSRRQMMRRFAARAARWPVRSKEWPCIVKVPIAIRRHDGEIQVKFQERKFDTPLDWRRAKRAFQEVAQYKVRSKQPYLRLAAYPNSTLSWAGIEAQLRIWEREGWVPDVIIVDYADIMDESGGPGGASEPRHMTNASWKKGRALSQKFHCLVVTATQADAASYTQELIRRQNFSEDKRKLAHVTGMLGINQKDEEKKLGAYRLNWIAVREGEYSEGATVCVAACLALGNPAVKSCF